MKLRQLEYVVEVVDSGMNVTAAAEVLFTSQPGISSQVRRLEEELGVQIFKRNGKHIDGLTLAGADLVERFREILAMVENVEKQAADYTNPDKGMLSIATTHTQARYVLPEIIARFREKYPNVALQIHQGTPEQIAAMAASGEADIGIATEALELFNDLVLLPCYRWNRCVMVPKGHPLASEDILTVEAIARYPIITYVFGVADRSVINRAFKEKDLKLDVVLTAADAEVIKTYVRNGLGIGLCARMAYDRKQDNDLQVLDAGHLFDSSVTSLAIRSQNQLRSYVYDFIQMFSPHLTPEVVKQSLETKDKHLQAEIYRQYVEKSDMR
ncbi:MAG: HTH-type transcriptional regulator CysB [Arenicella sp.]